MVKPIILLTFSYIVGLLFGQGFLYVPFSAAGSLAACVTLLLVLVKRRGLSLRLFFMMVIPAVFGTASLLYSAAFFPADHYTRLGPFGKKTHTMTGRIASPLDRDPGRTAFSLSLRSMDGMPMSGMVRLSVRDESVQAGYGDVIRARGRIFPPRAYQNPGGFDYPAYLASQGIHAIAAVKRAGDIEVLMHGSGVIRTIQDMRERIRAMFRSSMTGDGSAIVQAMILGEEGDLTDGLRDRFMAAGVTHILSISGSHLGLIAIVCFVLIRQALFLLPEPVYHRFTIHVDPKKIAALLTTLPVAFYAFLAGGQTATVRSLVMILCGLVALILDRENGLIHSLAAAALVILIPGPQALFDISFQLSYLSVVSILVVVHVRSELRMPAQGVVRKLRNHAVLLIAVSLAASVATAPLVVLYFNQFSLAGLLANMVVVPFAGFVIVPLGLFSGILSLVIGHLPLAALNQSAADAFAALVSAFSRLPLASLRLPAPGPAFLLAYAVFISAGAIFLRTRLVSRFKPLESSTRVPRTVVSLFAVSGAVLIILPALSSLPEKEVRMTFLDVGQGDSTLIETVSGKRILIDGGGTRDNSFDIGRRVVAPLLWNRGIGRIDLAVLSHPHPDHMHGLTSVLRTFAVREVWVSGLDTYLPGYRDFGQAIEEQGIKHRNITAGTPPVSLGDAVITVLHPGSGPIRQTRKAYADENNRSLVVRVDTGNQVFLFPGDIHAEAEAALLKAGIDVRCDLLKVAHHGSRTSSKEAFVNAAKPKVAIIPVGRDNQYGQPADEVVERFRSISADLYRTDRDGAVIVRAGRTGLRVIPWAQHVLRRISLDERRSWGTVERENWRRMWIRIWEI